MVNNCCIPGCKSNYKSMKTNVPFTAITVFSFPKNDVLRKEWIRRIPRDLTIVSKSDEITDLVTKLGTSTKRENSYNFIAEQLNILCLSPHRYRYKTDTVIVLHFKYIISPLLVTWNYNNYSVSRVVECYRMSRPVFKLMTIIIV